MTIPGKKKPPNKTKNKKKISVPKTKSLQVKDTEDELVINSKIYYSVNKVVTYFLSKYDRTYTQSLVDIGANGGVVGEGVRVICKTPDRKIYTHGINNREIIDVPSVTAGKVTQTTSEEVILILN